MGVGRDCVFMGNKTGLVLEAAELVVGRPALETDNVEANLLPTNPQVSHCSVDNNNTCFIEVGERT